MIAPPYRFPGVGSPSSQARCQRTPKRSVPLAGFWPQHKSAATDNDAAMGVKAAPSRPGPALPSWARGWGPEKDGRDTIPQADLPEDESSQALKTIEDPRRCWREDSASLPAIDWLEEK